MIAKIEEELQEVHDAASPQEHHEEVGDLLFAVVNLARHLKVDAEAALRDANVKFETRFRNMEQSAGARFTSLNLEQKEALWQQAKRALATK